MLKKYFLLSKSSANLVEEIEDTPFKFDFYGALKVYEVLPRG